MDVKLILIFQLAKFILNKKAPRFK